MVKFFGFLGLILTVLLTQTSCTEIAMSKAALSFALEDRPFGSSVQDSTAEISLMSDFFDYDHTIPVNVSVIVSERRALIVGELPSQEQIDKVTEIVWKNDYIIKVYNYIHFPHEDGTVLDTSRDAVLNKTVWARLVGTEDVTSSNYKTIVHDKILYVLGYSVSEEEKAKAIKAMRQVVGIRKIVSFIIIRPDLSEYF